MRLTKLLILLIATSASLLVIYTLLQQTTVPYGKHMKMKSRYEGPPYIKDKINHPYTDVTNTSQEKISSGIQTIHNRVQVLRNECRKRHAQGQPFRIQKSKLNHIVVNDKHQVMYCYVPKVACTNLKRIFLLLTGRMNVTDPLDLKSAHVHSIYDEYLTYLDSYTADEIQYRIKNYKKVIFVREPLERTLSAFRNKFLQQGNQYFKERFGRVIVKRYRNNPSQEALEQGNDVTFKEFTQYILDPHTKEQGYNEHWEPISGLCNPCLIKYDFIGKYESLDDDVDMLLKDLSVDDIIQFPKRGATYKTLKTEDTLLRFYKDIPVDMFQDLRKIYSDDNDIFGYSLPKNLEKLFGSY